MDARMGETSCSTSRCVHWLVWLTTLVRPHTDDIPLIALIPKSPGRLRAVCAALLRLVPGHPVQRTMAPKLVSVAAVAASVASTLAIANPPASVVPNFAANGAMAPPVTGPTFNKPLSTPDGVPEVGQQRAMELMRTGALFRYTPGVVSETALAEAAMVEYTGFKYVVGFNSCGSALFIALKALGVQPSEKVLCNAFSFTAVPSAIHHAGAPTGPLT